MSTDNEEEQLFGVFRKPNSKVGETSRCRVLKLVGSHEVVEPDCVRQEGSSRAQRNGEKPERAR